VLFEHGADRRAARVIEEDRLIAGLTGPSPVAALPMVLAAWRGDGAQRWD
jgi:hypothetical protein